MPAFGHDCLEVEVKVLTARFFCREGPFHNGFFLCPSLYKKQGGEENGEEGVFKTGHNIESGKMKNDYRSFQEAVDHGTNIL